MKKKRCITSQTGRLHRPIIEIVRADDKVVVMEAINNWEESIRPCLHFFICILLSLLLLFFLRKNVDEINEKD